MLKHGSAIHLIVVTAAAASANGLYFTRVTYVRLAIDFAYDISTFESEGRVTYDLVVQVDEGDSWTIAHFFIYTSDARGNCFWEQNNGRNTQPDPAMFPFFGLLAYDSFWTSSEEYPNPDLDPTMDATTFAPGSPIVVRPDYRLAEWYVDPEAPNADGGVYTIARITVSGTSTVYACGSIYFESTVSIPYIVGCVPSDLIERCPWDLTSDGRVTLDDLAVLLAYYGDSNAPWHHGDLDLDGDVDRDDLVELLAHYGEEWP